MSQAHADHFQRGHSRTWLCWLLAKGCGLQQGRGLCQHTRHQEGPPAWDTSVVGADKLPTAHSTARAASTLQGQVLLAELRQVSNRSDQSWYFCAASGFSPYFALQAEPHWDGKEQQSLQTVLAHEHIAFLQRDPTKQLPQLSPLCSIQNLPYFFIFKI